jgi:outer membrane protein
MQTRTALTTVATLALFTSATLPNSAFAQGHSASDHKEEGLQFTISAGIAAAPSYMGDDDYQTSVFPNISLSYNDRLKASFRGIEYTAISRDGWQAGPILAYDGGRDENPDESDFMISGEVSTDLVGLGDIDGTLELGGFVAYETRSFAAKFTLLQGVDGGHDGVKGNASVSYRGMFDGLGMPLFFSVGPTVSFADDAYNSTFFDVSAAQSAASGISVYDADGGVNAYGLNATLMMPVGEKTSVVGVLNYEQLVGDVGDSSIVQERGSQDQIMAAVFVNYRF